MHDANIVHISSLVVQVRPENVSSVIEQINARDIAEVQMSSAEGKLVVTLETQTQHDVTNFVDEIHMMEGVLNAILVYHQMEDVSALDDIVDIELPQSPLPENSEMNR